jgi:hypothetical protein
MLVGPRWAATHGPVEEAVLKLLAGTQAARDRPLTDPHPPQPTNRLLAGTRRDTRRHATQRRPAVARCRRNGVDLTSRLHDAEQAGPAFSDADLVALVQSLPYHDARREQACESLVARYQGLLRSIVQHYRSSPEMADELMQVGYLGLMKAINGFDPQRFRIPGRLGTSPRPPAPRTVRGLPTGARGSRGSVITPGSAFGTGNQRSEGAAGCEPDPAGRRALTG